MGHIAVGDIGVVEAPLLCQWEDIQRPLQREGGLVETDRGPLATSIYGLIHELQGRDVSQVLGFGLAYIPVLAPGAVEVTTPTARGQGQAAGVKVKEGLFLDGVTG